MAESIEFNLVEFASHVFSRRRLVVSLSLVLMLAFVIYVSAVQRSSFRATGTININMALKSQSLSPSRLTSWIEEQEMLTKVNLTERFFESSDYRRAVLAEVEGKTKYCAGENCEELKTTLTHELSKRRDDEELEKVEFLFSRLAIRADSSRFILNIVGTDRNPKIAHALSTIAIHTLIALNYELLLNKNSRVREFIESQTKVTGDDLAALEMSLVEEQKKSNLITTLETETRLTAIHLDYQQRLSTLIRDGAALELLEKEILHQIKEFKKEIASPNTVSQLYLSQLQNRFEVLKYQMAVEGANGRVPAGDNAELSKYRKILDSDKEAWVATDLWEQIKKAETFLIDVRHQRDKVSSETQAAQKSLERWNVEYLKMPDVLRRLTEIKRNIAISTEVYTTLKTRLQEMNIREAERANDLAILTYPDIPTEPIGLPYSKKLTLAVAAGPGLTLFLMLIGYILVPLVRSVADVESLGVRVLGRITQFRASKPISLGRTYSKILTVDPDAYEANSLRFLRFRLEKELNKSGYSEKGKIVVITSQHSGEGKTFTTVNLASAFAVSRTRVLLMDMDVKGSDMAFYFGQPKESIDIGTESTDIDFVLKIYEQGIHILSPKANRADVREYIRGREFDSVLERMRATYDYIFIDTPPLDSHFETYLLVSFADATLFVINHRSTLREDVESGIATLSEVKNGPLFAVLNFSNEGIKLLPRKKKLASA